MGARRKFFEDILHNGAMLALLLGMCLLPAALLFGAGTAYALLAAAIVPFFFNLFLRRKVRNAALFLLAHLLFPAAAFFLIPGLPLKLAALAVLAVMDVLSISQRLSRNPRGYGASLCVAGVAVLIVMCFLAGARGLPRVANVYPALAALMFGAYILYSHMANVDSSLDAITMTSVQPVKDILSFNNRAMTAFMVILLLVVIISPFLMIDKVVLLAGKGLLNGLRFILSRLFDNAAPAAPAPTDAPAPVPGMGQDMIALLGPPGESGRFWDVLQNIILGALYILMFPAAAALVVVPVFLFIRRFNRTRKNGADDIESIAPDAVFKDAARRLRNAVPSIFRENRTRRLFRKKMQAHLRAGAPLEPSDTPWQMERKITKEDLRDLVKEYEEVRYGKE
ncbi:MAG: hypothetical protein FWC55_00545 [Firmicutes bacterium]|nr:hypothetical protein [Bacillota bacterium]